ncbi:MAG: curli production assembly/transport component CsgG [Candidatus Cloacimonetes bacterium HGW-Cloacimonetes-3]|nr:MAG: curli production assembly/transport component CsgG [Candidatus Cloacimonetes bacterium HGW-Cloacimonetes-3]
MKHTIVILCLSLLLLGGCAKYQSEQAHQTLSITPASAIPVVDEAVSLKKKVAIGKFTNESRLANSFLNEGSNTKERMSKAATDILTAKLAMTNRYLLIERQDDMAVSNEQQIANIQSYKIPADYLILGSISEFGRNTSGNVGLIDRTKKQTAYAKVTLRLVDTRNGMIIFGEEGSGEASSEVGTVLGMGSQAGFDESLTDKAIDAAISSVIQNLMNKLAHDPWRSYVLSMEGNDMYISGGAKQGIKVGDTFKVYQRGKQVINPQTKIPIELPGTQIATIQVKQTIPGEELTELSLATVIQGSIPASALENIYISDK